MGRVGSYVIHREIGRGGTSVVFVGTDLRSGKRVAAKRLHEFLAEDPSFAAMLTDEVRFGAAIRHPNAVPLRDLVREGGAVYAIMDYVHGESLAGLRKLSAAPVPAEVAVAIACDVLSGLHAAHEARTPEGEPLELVHRDVAPDNVLVGVDGVARITDFGIAKAVGRSQVTATGMVKGKFRYMAPEQAGGETSRRSDLFSLGVVLWELLTGTRLFDAEHEATILAQLISHPIPAPSSVCASVSPALDAVVMRALSRKAKARFETALEMREALLTALAPQKPATPERVAAWLQELAAEPLAARMAALEADEAAARSMPPPAPAPEAPPPDTAPGPGPPTDTLVFSMPPPARQPWRAVTGLLFALTVLAVGAGIAWSALHRTPPAAAAATAPIAPQAPSSLTLGDPAPLPLPVVSAQVPPTVAPTRASRGPTTPPRPVGRAAPPDCDPPYTVDAKGLRIYRRECL
jgi:eukaryotic-like serine/threonine-protein kinase